ncbi:hypothetical protein FHX44_115335 [Pseudonocardia hierapolitana]|uniref:Ig-like domain-containing protein n=2 Tax=Pseudonocardia hierapolitana TaxID=1128676 RepID=A0A561SX11_9PSEU|nr:hypothetical protein FHX44_115335 [Pseudonocardia hierapolitana]
MPSVKILYTQSRSAAARLLVAVASVALLTAGCSSSVTGEASPASDAPSDAGASPSPSRSSGRPAAGTCQIKVSTNGSIVSRGAGGRTITTNGRTSFSCGRQGPMIAIESIDASGVTFSADGAPVTVAPGATETVGAYRISVSTADASGAEFQVEPA